MTIRAKAEELIALGKKATPGQDERLCGSCGLPIHPAESGVRHMGYYTCHSSGRCVDLLKRQIAAFNDGPEIARALVTAMQYLREGHEKFHGHFDFDNCQVRDLLRAFYGEGR